MPSEAEWEYAARAGTTTKYFPGNSLSCTDARFAQLRGACGNERKTVVVGRYFANAFGLHDMHGNVAEWTADCYHNRYEGGPVNGDAWMTGSCNKRVLRGGAWSNIPHMLRSAYRHAREPKEALSGLGFRVAEDI